MIERNFETEERNKHRVKVPPSDGRNLCSTSIITLQLFVFQSGIRGDEDQEAGDNGIGTIPSVPIPSGIRQHVD